jgi:hypothetical protein
MEDLSPAKTLVISTSSLKLGEQKNPDLQKISGLA